MGKYQGRHWHMSPEEEAEYEIAYKELKEAQKSCLHSWETVMGFTGTIDQCKYCDMSKKEHLG